MQLKVTGRHIDLTDAIKTHIEEKAEKLPRYNNSVNFVEAIIEGAEGGKNPNIEIIVKGGHDQLFVAKESSKQDNDLYSMIDKAFHKMERQIRKAKEKERNPIHSVSQ